MQNDKFISILTFLEDNQYHTALSLAKRLKVSDKTVRCIIKEVNSILSVNKCAYIETKHGIGCRLIVNDANAFFTFKEDIIKKEAEGYIPSTSKGRIKYLIDYLLNSKDYVKIASLQDILYVSRNTLTADIKEAEKELNKFNLNLIRKPNRGIKVTGNEFNFRLCLANYIAENDKSALSANVFGKDYRDKMEKIAFCIDKSLREQEITISEMAFQNLLIHIYVAIIRMETGAYVPLDLNTINKINKSNEFNAASKILKSIEKTFDMTFPKEEISYIAIHLAGKKFLPGSVEAEDYDNIVISPALNNIAIEMIEKVYKSFRFDFRDNLELRMSLCQHLLALDIRVRYNLNLQNPLLNDIKERFSLAYAMASQACMVISQYYGKKLKDDEIGYIALAFALALERNRTSIAKKNVLVVCATGKGSAVLMGFRYKEEFGRYINEINACDVTELNKIDFTNIDYIFTTVPIGIKVPVPIMEVKYFLDDSSIKTIRNILVKGNQKESMKDYYLPELFIPNLKCRDKNEAIRLMCGHISKYIKLPENFYELVLKREELARTEFGNNVAMPHPNDAIEEKTFVCVAVLEEKVLWGERDVQVVFLVSVERDTNIDLQNFYTITSRFLLSEDCINELIETRSYDALMDMLGSIENKNSSERC